MVIKFLCPNGHQLNAPENLAGKGGKCPKCQAAFVVPTLEELAHADQDATSERLADPLGGSKGGSGSIGGGSAKPSGDPASGSRVARGEIFIFLCPNGHKLNGPPSLKGKIGQCPHCGVKFHIPTDEEIAEQEAADSQMGQGDSQAESDDEILDVPADQVVVEVDPPPEGYHALGYIVARLWDRRDEETEIELLLDGEERYVPEYYCDNLSVAEYGVFAREEPDGSLQITVIPWSRVQHVRLNHLGYVPRPMFR
jgi:hypothetical protein